MATIGQIALVANLGSGQGDADVVEEMLRDSGVDVATFPPDRATDAARSGPDRLLIAGGDGSIAPAACAAGRAGIPVGVIPVGTANDFAAAAGLPDDLEDSCRLALEGRQTRSVDLGWLGDRPFVNVVSVGLAPAAARRAAGLKDRLGSLAYLAGAIRAGLSASPVACGVTCDERQLLRGDAWQVTVGFSMRSPGIFDGLPSVGLFI